MECIHPKGEIGPKRDEVNEVKEEEEGKEEKNKYRV